MPVTLAEILAPYGVAESEYLLVLAHALSSSAGHGTASLADPDRRFLERHGGVKAPPASTAAHAWLVAVTSNSAEQLASSLSVTQVASALQLSEWAVRRRVRRGTLYAFKLGRKLRLPVWQFDSLGRPLPGLRTVLAVLDPGLHPLEVAGFMTGPDADLEISGGAASPSDWLAGGRDPEKVASLGSLIGIGY